MVEVLAKVGDIVWGNALQVSGVPYRAVVEELKGRKAKLRPIAGETVLTAGSAKARIQTGPSVRARWVDARWLKPVR